MAKKLCKFRKDVVAQLDEIETLVSRPQFACRSCARVANSADNLCTAVPMGLAVRLQPDSNAIASSSESSSEPVQYFTPTQPLPDFVELKGKKASKKSRKRAKKQAKKLKKLLKKVAKSQKQLAKSQRRLDKGIGAMHPHSANVKNRRENPLRLH
jgi:hypothetical protein